MMSRTTKVLNKLKKITGEEFIEKNKEIFFEIPKHFLLVKKNMIIMICLLYIFFILYFLSYKEKSKKNHFFVTEIGGGYGGLIHNIKKNFPNAVCILFDLPEQNYISNFYLKQLYPNAKVLNLETPCGN